ncbi:salivary peroxidase/catechol oxidase-like [Panulirus ornatus]|uniref:salivary peroxidase/catechol oxidase-like n=1 Tax=Panulirus ornatus TaxID=150431 RepID=UPI003A88A1F3
MVDISYRSVVCMMVAIVMHGRHLSATIVSCEESVPLALRKPHQLTAHISLDHDSKFLVSRMWPLKDKEWYLRHWQTGQWNHREASDPPNTDPHNTSSNTDAFPDNSNSWKHSEFDTNVITDEDMQEALSYGIDKFRDTEKTEKTLYEKNIYVPKDSSAYRHQSFRRFSPMSKMLSTMGIIMDYSTEAMSKNLKLSKEVLTVDMILLEQRIFCEPEMLRPEAEPCNASSPYRTPDGTCNNLENPLWGASFTPHRRVLPADYGDGVSTLRRAADGGELPNARFVSTSVNLQTPRRSSCMTMLFTTFGQFIDHDLTFTPITKGKNGTSIPCCTKEVTQDPSLLHSQCAPIDIPVDDPFYGAYRETCMEFVRSSPAHRCNFGPRDQLNELTSLLDVSQVYGSTKNVTEDLRTFTDGLLETQLSTNGQELLPPSTDMNEDCNTKEQTLQGKLCFKAGDVRVNEQIGLAVLTTILVREHNRLARGLKQLNPSWDDERLYQEARRIVVAQMQHITYNEYLPLVVGPGIMKSLGLLPQGDGQHTEDYDPTIHPGVSNEFASAAFRFGHSMIPTNMLEVKANGTTTAQSLNSVIFKPFAIYTSGFSVRNVRGQAAQSVPVVDTLFTLEVTGKLFRMKKQFGLDLVAFNIHRGRDHGIPGYNAVRRACGLPNVSTFKQLAKYFDPQILRIIKNIYRSVNDIDLFVGGLAEKPVPGGLLGPTFVCLIADQFLRLKIADRFWYEYKGSSGSFTTDQLREIHQVSLARIICDNLPKISSIQRWPLEVTSAFNPVLQCSSKCIPKFSLYHWRE